MGNGHSPPRVEVSDRYTKARTINYASSIEWKMETTSLAILLLNNSASVCEFERPPPAASKHFVVHHHTCTFMLLLAHARRSVWFRDLTQVHMLLFHPAMRTAVNSFSVRSSDSNSNYFLSWAAL